MAGRWGRIAPLFIVLAVFAGYTGLASRTTLWDRDEPRFTRAAVEMLESRDYLIPRFNDEPWPDKPVLTYWLQALAIRVLGPTELACRLFAVVGTALTCGLTFCIGRRTLGNKAGLWAMLILPCTFQILVIGGAATSDAILLPFTVAAMALFARSREASLRLSDAILLGLAIGFAMLTKGPMGLMPLVAIGTILWLERKHRTGSRVTFLRVGLSLVVGTLVFFAWALPANMATHGEFLRVFVGRHVITRALKPMEHHGGNLLLYLPYYFPVVMGGFLPWTLHLPGAIVALVGGRLGVGGRRFFAGWIVPPFVIMSLAATKLPHYVVFIWPALALIVGGTIVAAQQGLVTEREKRWLRGGIWFFGPPMLIIGLGLMIGPWFVQVPGLRWSGFVAGAVILVMGAVAIRQQLADRPWASATTLLAGMLVFQVPLWFGVLPAMEHVKISPSLAREVATLTTEDVPVSTYKYGEPTLNFYIGRHIERLTNPQSVVAWAAQPGPRVLIIPRDRVDEIQRRFGRLPVQELASVSGYNYSKGKALEVLVMYHGGRE